MWRRGGRSAKSLQCWAWRRTFSSQVPEKEVLDVAGALQTQVPGNDNLESTMGIWPKFMETPVTCVSELLDTVHSATGAPWWLVLAGSTVAMRSVLFPVTVIESQKTSKFFQNAAKLPKPVPMPGSGNTVAQQFKLFSEKRKELGLPTPLWFLAPFFIQMPLFVTWIMTIRYMAISGYPGLDTGGALWFKDLTVPINGFPGILFPVSVASLFITNLEIGLKGVGKKPGLFGSWMRIYKWWLRACTIPIFMSGFYLPQGVYMYWLPNSLFSLSQTLVLKSRPTRKLLGLPVAPPAPQVVASNTKTDSSMLVKLAAEHFAFNNLSAAVECLKLAIQKDPDDPSIYYSLGNVHSGAAQWAEAAEAHGVALSKVKDDEDLKISVTTALGIALFNQGKKAEGCSALRSLDEMDVPTDGMCRKKYYMALVTLGSMLKKQGQKVEALECFQRVAEYDPKIDDILVKPLREELADQTELQGSKHV